MTTVSIYITHIFAAAQGAKPILIKKKTFKRRWMAKLYAAYINISPPFLGSIMYAKIEEGAWQP